MAKYTVTHKCGHDSTMDIPGGKPSLRAWKLEQAELMRTPAPTAPKAAGTAVANPWVFEVTDIKALHAARPELVDLVVRRADITTRIRQGEREIMGLRIYQDTKVVVRT